MAHKFLFKSTLAVCLFFTAPLTYGETFVAHDDSFRIDENTGWQEAAPMTIDGVLALEKDKTRLDIRRTECTNETCLDQLVNQDLAEIKSKNMTVTPNATTGQEINRVEFASGEPFFYIHFAKGASRFSAGYFLINGRVYSVLVKNAVFDQIDPLFAAISPLAQTPQQENAQPETDDKTAQQDALTERSYDTEMMPEVEADGAEHTANAPAENTPFAAFTPEVAQPETEEPVSFEEPVLPEVQTPAVAAPAARPDARKITPAKLKHYALRAVRLFKSAYREGRITTFIAPNMPPYLKALGRVFDVAVLFVICFILLFAVTALLRLFIPVRRLRQPINPHSSYPVRIRRLYGTPAVVCRARDNQGNTLIALASRWDSLFLFSGMMISAVALLVLAGCGLCEQLRVAPLTDTVYTSVYGWGALALIIGIFLILLGYVWTQFTQKEIILFDRKGKKAAVMLQQGFWRENYQIYFALSKDTLTVKRSCLLLRKQYCLFNEKETLLTEVKERSALRALLRKFTGHLWGLLRADYDIVGSTDSRGGLESTHSAFSRFICFIDKPEAVSSRDLLALSLLIAIRDREKWYPWIG